MVDRKHGVGKVEKRVAQRPVQTGSVVSEADGQFRGLRVGYLVNEYPKVSHTFIRREILALEALGVEIDRYAIRGWDMTLADPQDEAERGRTRYLLDRGLWPLLKAVARTAFSRPRAFFRALGLALRLSRGALRPLPYHLVYLAHACRLLEWLRVHPVDHLHAHFGTNPAETALLLNRLGGPSYSFTVHGADEADHARYLALDTKTASARFVVAISAYTRGQFLRHVPPDQWDKVKIVHCGIDRSFFAEGPAPFPECPRFLSIGRFSGEKGHLILLDAFAQICRDDAAPKAELVLAGDGELRGQIEARIAEAGLGDRVRITGWISSDQVREEILAATCLVQPSFQEGLPVVIMEAMAVGRPVISTYVAGIPELVRPEETGWLVPTGDVSALAEAMTDCLERPGEALAGMGMAAITRARARHSIDREAVKLATLFADKKAETPVTQTHG